MNLSKTIEIMEGARKLDGKMKYQGLDISIENRAGSVRRGVDQDGKEWATKMHLPYGYIRKTEGTDGDHVDCFIGPDKHTSRVYIIHIKNPKTGKYDEDKVFLGAYSGRHARKLFNKHYDKPERFYQGMTVMSMNEFKKKILNKTNHGEKIAANFDRTAISMAYLDPIPTFHPPSGKKGKSRVPTDEPMETDNKFLDVTKREESYEGIIRRLQRRPVPLPVGSTAVQHHTGGTNDYLGISRLR